MGKYATGGACTTAINPATASSNQLLGPAMRAGRELWIRSIWALPTTTAGPLVICDASVGSTATGAVFQFYLDIDTSTGQVTIIDIPAPGLRFRTNPVCHLDASGSIGIGECGYSGYEYGQ